MKKILHVMSSPRGSLSFSIQLGNVIVSKLQARYPDSILLETDLTKRPLPHLDDDHVSAFLTPADKRTPAQQAKNKESDQVVQEVMDADIIVIGAPLYNYGIHSSLKIWIDHLIRVGLTFRYTENGFEGLVKGKKTYIAMSSGAVYSDGPMQSYDFVVPYLKAVLAHIGITDITVARVEGTAIPGIKEHAWEKGCNAIEI
ncbi:NAD(P)H-dependent oxidoreductase [Chitinophaga pendula]|uniref:FMN-dependent NADH-azoreductase n=1 Tax=Chitinophaga TaxID=79328 RepID=UPI000BAEF3C6|nr:MULTISPECIES: NAD(P)H-dependent oxidoreductase [Chitinophaga]ASZ12633.1 FMN-dependent NADH-azoreductase [Chitinophaga sp. MD30]UCJ09757.1 NAD(P)H-dependent oxidoreductase [Chitinophaga pendula]